MFAQKKKLKIFLLVLLLSMLAACSNGAGTNADKSMPLSDALENHALWFKMASEKNKLSDDATVEEVFLFENGHVTKYEAGWLTLEELAKMTDDEIIAKSIEHIKETAIVYEEPEAYAYTVDLTLDDDGNIQYANIETEPETICTVVDDDVQKTIDKTVFSGLRVHEETEQFAFFITRTTDEDLRFTLDAPETTKQVVTIGQAKHLEELRKARIEAELRKREKEIPPEVKYKQYCAACHAQDMGGFVGPPLDQVGKRLTEEEIYDIIVNGRGDMPGGTAQTDDNAKQLAEWLSEMK